MATITLDRPETAIRRGLAGFEAFCDLIDHPLEPYQRRIARAYFGRAREVAAILPRGNAKTTLAALIGLHHLLTDRGASVVIGAASVQQARICFERIEGFLDHPELEGMVTLRHLELRYEGEDGKRRLRVIPSDGPRTHGLSCTLYVADEVWAWSIQPVAIVRPRRTGQQDGGHGGGRFGCLRQALRLAAPLGEVRGVCRGDEHEHGSPRGQRRLRYREDGGGRSGDAVMAAKKVKLQVIADAVQHDGKTFANGQQFEVSQAKAKELLAAGTVIKIS